MFSRTSIKSTTSSLRDIKFPSIYVCNVNQVTKAFLYDLALDNATESTNTLIKTFIDGVKENETINQVRDPISFSRLRELKI